MRAFVALALVAMLALSGCSGKKKDADADHAHEHTAPLAPTLLLAIQVGNHTYNFTSVPAASASGNGSSAATSTTHHHGNATANATSSSGTTTASVKANATKAGNSTGNASMPSGVAPLNVTFKVSATGLGNSTVQWALDFGDALGNKTSGNASSAAKSNSTGNAVRASGSKLPGMANHTYLRAGNVNVTYVLRSGNTTLGTLKATIHIGNATSNVTVTKALPAVTHFEFGESWGCTGDTPAGITCLDWLSGPTGNDIDGHWIQLDPSYWGLSVVSTLQVNPDSDCAFTAEDATTIVGDANNGGSPCAGTVPDGAIWLFIYPYGVGTLGMTVDFAPAA